MLLASMTKPEKPPKSDPIEFATTPKLVAYLDDLVAAEGFGNTRAEIARNFVWKEINRLLEQNRLKPR